MVAWMLLQSSGLRERGRERERDRENEEFTHQSGDISWDMQWDVNNKIMKELNRIEQDFRKP